MSKNLKELCEDLNITSKELGGDAHLLSLTEDLTVTVYPLRPGFSLYSPISACPQQKREELYIHLMKANLFGQGTLGAAIGYEEKENLLTASYSFPYDMDYRAFKESVEDFANIIDYWRAEIALHVQRAKEEIL